MRVTAGTGDAINRLAREMSGYYLLTFGTDSNGKADARQKVELSTRRTNVTVRVRSHFFPSPVVASSASAPAADALLAVPHSFRELPLRTAIFAQRGAEPGAVKLVVVTETRAAPSTPPVIASFGIVTADLKIGNGWKAYLVRHLPRPSPPRRCTCGWSCRGKGVAGPAN